MDPVIREAAGGATPRGVGTIGAGQALGRFGAGRKVAGCARCPNDRPELPPEIGRIPASGVGLRCVAVPGETPGVL
jgi:hypothetical protein